MKNYLLSFCLFLGHLLYAQPDQGVYYEIFVRSFSDSDGDGIGDIRGITQKLGYLQDLGISGLWLTPIHPSPSYHKYDVLDYRAIDPEYGTIADYQALVAEAHKRGIKVLLDLVVNHTGSDHPWFKASCERQAGYRDYYVWSDTARSHGWYPGPKDSQERYYAFFWERMPDLNFDHPDVRKEIIAAGKFWLKEAGVDGYRLDAAQHIYEADDVIKNNQWWSEFRKAMQEQKNDVMLVGEVWNKDSIVATYLKSSLDASFNFDLSGAITRAIKDTNSEGFVEKLTSIHQVYRSYKPDFVDATFISNHDQDRYRSTFGGDLPQTRQAFALLMTLPGMPFVYYGEEIGMLGKWPDEYRREPFLWSRNEKANTSWEIPRYSTLQTVVPLSEQVNDPHSLFTYYKRMIALRNHHPVLSTGRLVKTSLIPQSRWLIAYELSTGKDRVLVVHNISPQKQDVKFPAYRKAIHGKARSKGMEPYSTVILKLKPLN